MVNPFPIENLLLFIAFCVIAVTLIALGAALPAVARLLGLTSAGRQEADADKRNERRVRLEGIDEVLKALDTLPTRCQPAARAAIGRWHADRRERLAVTADQSNQDDPVAEASRLQLELIDVERASIARAYADKRLTDEARRRIERELDLEGRHVSAIHWLVPVWRAVTPPTDAWPPNIASCRASAGRFIIAATSP